MLLTRVGFLKLLAVVGIGQATQTQPTQPSGDVLIQTGPLSDPSTRCLKPSADHQGWEYTKCYAGCEKGEEKCPLGHCQKPSLIYPVEYNNEPGQFEGSQTVDTSGKLHVCSTCKIVYTK